MGIFDREKYKDIEDGEEFSDIIKALNTCCHLCGEVLEWEAKIKYDEIQDQPHLTITSSSCGLRFKIEVLSCVTTVEEE